jgi:uncharacterized protein (DUF58 family)
VPEPALQQRLRSLGTRHAGRLYILPTRYGLLYACLLLAMLAGAINYTLSLGFALTFLLAGLALVAMLHAWRNLAGIGVEIGRAEPVFVGENVVFEVIASERDGRVRHAVSAHLAGGPTACSDIPANDRTVFRLTVPAARRGWLAAPRLTCATEFPLLLFHVWRHSDFAEARCLIYPRPAPPGLPLPDARTSGPGTAPDAAAGDEDFVGHRAYQHGDAPIRVDWKASSREQGLLVKQYHGTAQRTLWLDWDAAPGNDAEQRISQLTRWVLEADAAGARYGLRLPRQTLAPAVGAAHYRRCLQALALME